MKKVIIIGASFAGLACARELARSDFNVLILEKNSDFGQKVCASGVTKQDTMFISPLEMNYSLEPVFLCANNRKIQMPAGRGLISSIDRPNLIKKWVAGLSGVSNIELKLGAKVKEIKQESVVISTGEEFCFDYLIGADGANSIVRRYLNIPTKKYLSAVQYITRSCCEKFELYADEPLFEKGYAWLFPNKNFSSVGACVDSSCSCMKNVRKNLDKWIKKIGVDLTTAKFEGFIINFDYKGYKFKNIFLAGDAAGLTNGLTGKGIYAACLSGKVVAQELLGKNAATKELDTWIEEKLNDEKELLKKGNFIIRKMETLDKLNSIK
jgi:flavin-dependent dehydrogenase